MKNLSLLLLALAALPLEAAPKKEFKDKDATASASPTSCHKQLPTPSLQPATAPTVIVIQPKASTGQAVAISDTSATLLPITTVPSPAAPSPFSASHHVTPAVTHSNQSRAVASNTSPNEAFRQSCIKAITSLEKIIIDDVKAQMIVDERDPQAFLDFYRPHNLHALSDEELKNLASGYYTRKANDAFDQVRKNKNVIKREELFLLIKELEEITKTPLKPIVHEEQVFNHETAQNYFGKQLLLDAPQTLRDMIADNLGRKFGAKTSQLTQSQVDAIVLETELPLEMLQAAFPEKADQIFLKTHYLPEGQRTIKINAVDAHLLMAHKKERDEYFKENTVNKALQKSEVQPEEDQSIDHGTILHKAAVTQLTNPLDALHAIEGGKIEGSNQIVLDTDIFTLHDKREFLRDKAKVLESTIATRNDTLTELLARRNVSAHSKNSKRPRPEDIQKIRQELQGLKVQQQNLMDVLELVTAQRKIQKAAGSLIRSSHGLTSVQDPHQGTTDTLKSMFPSLKLPALFSKKAEVLRPAVLFLQVVEQVAREIYEKEKAAYDAGLSSLEESVAEDTEFVGKSPLKKGIGFPLATGKNGYCVEQATFPDTYYNHNGDVQQRGAYPDTLEIYRKQAPSLKKTVKLLVSPADFEAWERLQPAASSEESYDEVPAAALLAALSGAAGQASASAAGTQLGQSSH